jgi:hypothetical protein
MSLHVFWTQYFGHQDGKKFQNNLTLQPKRNNCVKTVSKKTTKKQIITFDTQVVNACEILIISLLMNGTL